MLFIVKFTSCMKDVENVLIAYLCTPRYDVILKRGENRIALFCCQGKCCSVRKK